jgi:hypothetical protein
LSVNPLRSMKAATAELETALEGLGADMPSSTRRQTALLASEMIAQVAGGDGERANESVDLIVRFRPNRIRLEARGPSMPSVSNEPDSDGTPVLAAWGHFLLNRLASRWGIDGSNSWILWAEVDFA